jgi:hypothetical protein
MAKTAIRRSSSGHTGEEYIDSIYRMRRNVKGWLLVLHRAFYLELRARIETQYRLVATRAYRRRQQRNIII